MGPEPGTDEAFERATVHALRWLGSLAIRRVPSSATADEVAAVLGTDLPGPGEEPAAVIDRLAAAVEPGLMASASGRFYGWVMGGTLPAAAAADWLVTAWDQNAGMRDATPGVVAVEEVAAGWLLQLLGLPAGSSVGFASGATMANFTCLAAARGRVLQRVGWDVGADGLSGAPRIRVFVGEEGHGSVDVALRYLGLGAPERVAVDDQGRLDGDALAAALAKGAGPAIVCLQAGNVHSGSFDPFLPAVATAHRAGAWVHVDGAFGLWAAAVPSLAPLTDGIADADSWATDAHKTLNTPYDCGIAVVADAESVHFAMGLHASYLLTPSTVDPLETVPELSRRARGVPVWAALASLGSHGVQELVEGLVSCAQAIADGIARIPGAEVLNDVVYTQVCVTFGPDERTRAVFTALMDDGVVMPSASMWHGRAVLRFSVSNWRTGPAEVGETVAAVERAARAVAVPAAREERQQ
jgi:glutamate/tyrosine decarboxylase-like PLP-dependent enzyme